jgi:hypothetical protein
MTTDEQTDMKRFQKIIRHITHVQQACLLLAERLIEQDQMEKINSIGYRENEAFARQLVANSMLHDNSKFYGIEWFYLHEDVKLVEPKLFQDAVTQHQLTNCHHPEYWGGIKYMPTIYVAEMVCDWKARSDEFGTDLRIWIKENAVKRYEITMQGTVYKQIKNFTDLLLDPKFV